MGSQSLHHRILSSIHKHKTHTGDKMSQKDERKYSIYIAGVSIATIW